jgi:hypothetical protein
VRDVAASTKPFRAFFRDEGLEVRIHRPAQGPRPVRGVHQPPSLLSGQRDHQVLTDHARIQGRAPFVAVLTRQSVVPPVFNALVHDPTLRPGPQTPRPTRHTRHNRPVPRLGRSGGAERTLNQRAPGPAGPARSNPVCAQRMGQARRGAGVGEHVRRPIPTVGRSLRARPPGSHPTRRPGAPAQRGCSRSARTNPTLPVRGRPHDHAAPPVQIYSAVLTAAILVHRGLPRVDRDRQQEPLTRVTVTSSEAGSSSHQRPVRVSSRGPRSFVGRLLAGRTVTGRHRSTRDRTQDSRLAQVLTASRVVVERSERFQVDNGQPSALPGSRDNG